MLLSAWRAFDPQVIALSWHRGPRSSRADGRIKGGHNVTPREYVHRVPVMPQYRVSPAKAGSQATLVPAFAEKSDLTNRCA